jgi:hypothetical protein
MTLEQLFDERRRAMNLLHAYEAGSIMNLGGAEKEDLANQQTEISIAAVREQIAELERRIASHPDRTPDN